MAEEEAQIAAELFKKDDADYDAAVMLLGNTVNRAKALFDPKPVGCKDGADLDALNPYKIALIPYSLTVRTLKGGYIPGGNFPPEGAIILKERHFDHFALCVNDEGQLARIDQWCDNVITLCGRAANKGARFILLPELSHPNFWPGRLDHGDFQETDRRRRLIAARSRLEGELQQLATAHGCIIISGSYHDWETFENISPIYFPYAQHTRGHKKLTAAYAVDEHIKTAHGVGYPVYHTNERRFCVLICTDAFDLNMFFRQILATTSGHAPTTPEIYFVPSFNVPTDSSHAMKDACRQLSLATGQTVVFVNHANDPDGKAVFVAGTDVPLNDHGSFYMAELNPALITERAARTARMRRALNAILRPTRRVF